jgi:hypothetical protein
MRSAPESRAALVALVLALGACHTDKLLFTAEHQSSIPSSTPDSGSFGGNRVPSAGASGSGGQGGSGGAAGNTGHPGDAGSVEMTREVGPEATDAATSPVDGSSEVSPGDARDAGAASFDGFGLSDAVATRGAAAACTKSGWCWSTPTPTGNELYAIAGSSPFDVWAVGEVGTILHWNGQAWGPASTGSRQALRGVWAYNAMEAWAVGDEGLVLHFDGDFWLPRSPGAEPEKYHWRAVWGSGPADVWLVGLWTDGTDARGTLAHWQGVDWTLYDEPESLGAVWGVTSKDVWALGEGQPSSLYHWDGQQWGRVVRAETPYIGTALWGTGPDNLWLGEREGLPKHWDGTSVTSDASDMEIWGLWGSRSNDVWAVGLGPNPQFGNAGMILHWDGVTWSAAPSTGAGHLNDVWGSRADDVWAVGMNGTILHWDGKAWSAPMWGSQWSPGFVWGSSSSDVWAFGWEGTGLVALRWNGQSWSKVDVLSAAAAGASAAGDVRVDAVWGSGASDIWLAAMTSEPDPVHSNGITVFVHWDGQRWSVDKTLDAALAARLGVFQMSGTGPNDVWGAGMEIVSTDASTDFRGSIVHWDGAKWSSVTSNTPGVDTTSVSLRSVWASGPHDVWFGGDGTLFHWDGSKWTAALSSTLGNTFYVSGSGPNDVWVASWASGNTATAIDHWDGAIWHEEIVDIYDPRNVFAVSPTDVWVSGYSQQDESQTVHWDGHEWLPSDTGATVLGSSPWRDEQNGLWMAALGGVIRHR